MEEFKVTAVIIFAFTMSITPGPNNIMLTASGASFGFRRTIPHILGIVAGMAMLNILSAFGLKQLFYKWPQLKSILKILGFSYMVYLGVKNLIINMKTDENSTKSGKPFSFIEAAFFQILNPKALLMSISSMTLYTLNNELFVKSSIYIVVIFMVCCLPSISLWAGFGTVIKRVIKKGRGGKLVNIIIGLLTIGCAVYILF